MELRPRRRRDPARLVRLERLASRLEDASETYGRRAALAFVALLAVAVAVIGFATHGFQSG